jgi:hypothetical protein
MRFIAMLIILAAAPVSAESADWKQLDFLLGKWVGVSDAKDTQLGAGGGACSFELDLNNKVIVRHNTASYDSGVTHGDLMVIYTEGAKRAIYFDSEEHVIRYNLSIPSPNRAVFESDRAQPGPKYRLSYWIEGASLRVKFEIAPPGGEYKTYTSGALKRDSNAR